MIHRKSSFPSIAEILFPIFPVRRPERRHTRAGRPASVKNGVENPGNPDACGPRRVVQ